jgi:hypothetical protein
MTADGAERRTRAAPRHHAALSIAVRAATALGVLGAASVIGCHGSYLGGLSEGKSQSAFWDVCQGQGVDNSAEYVDSPTTRVHKVAAVYTYVDKDAKYSTPIPKPDFSEPSVIPFEFPGSWGTDKPEEVELVLCIHEPVGTMVSDCGLYKVHKSKGDTTFHIVKNQYSRYIELREARTGTLVASTTMQGRPPQKCQNFESGDTGYDVSSKSIETWLRDYVEAKKE